LVSSYTSCIFDHERGGRVHFKNNQPWKEDPLWYSVNDYLN